MSESAKARSDGTAASKTVAELGLHLLAASFQGGFQLLDEFGEARCRLVRAKAVVDGAELVAEM